MTSIISLRAFCGAQRAGCSRRSRRSSRSNRRPTTRRRSIAAARELAARLAARSAAASTRLPRADRGDHLRAPRVRPRRLRQVLLLGHFDTVWPVGQLERMPLRSGRPPHGPGVFDMKAGIAIAMLGDARARRNRRAARQPRRDALDDRRGDRQRHVARADRGRSAAERGGAGARAVAAGRRAEDRAGRACGELRARWCTACGARRDRSEQGRERDPRAGASDPRARRAPGSRARHHASTSASSRRHALECRRRRGARDRWSARADAGATRSWSSARSARLRPRDPARGSRSPAASTGRRWNAPPASRVCTSRRAPSRATLGRELAGGDRRRVGREFHGGAGCPDSRRPRRRRRRRARAARARRLDALPWRAALRRRALLAQVVSGIK